MSWLAKNLMISFALIAFIVIVLISIILRFSLVTSLIRIFAGSLIFSIIGGLLGEIIYRNVNFAAYSQEKKATGDETVDEMIDDEGEAGSGEKNNNRTGEAKESNSEIEPLEFEDLDDEEDNVVNNIDGEQGAEIIREMSQDN